MWTQSYKGLYIHGYCDKSNCRVTTGTGEPVKSCKSLHAAKIAITQHLKG